MSELVRGHGRLVNHDPQNRDHAAPRLAVRPRSWLHDLGPVLDQGRTNGCTGWAMANWLNAARGWRARQRWNRHYVMPKGGDRRYIGDDTGLEIYKRATRFDPFRWVYPPTDAGSSALGVAKALKAAGVIDAYLWTFEFGQMLAHGASQPLLLGLLWTDPMNDPDSKGFIHIGTDRQISAAASSGVGHEVLLRGVNFPRGYATIRNQWSSQWGDDGEARIPLTELERLIIDYQGDVLVPEVVS